MTNYWEKLKDDIQELPKWLQILLKKGVEKGYITEDEILSQIDEIDKQLDVLEKFYDLADKLNIKIETIEEVLKKEIRDLDVKKKIGNIKLIDDKYKINDKQYKDFIKLYFNDVSTLPLLTAEEEKQLARLVRQGDEMAKRKLVEGNLRLVISIAKRFLGSKLSFMDLIQEWNMWLLKAIEKFDPDKNFKFSTYATWWIKQSITKAIADMTKNVRMPVHLIEEINAYNKALQELFQSLWREPTVQEIAKKLWVSEKKIVYIEKMIKWEISIEKPVWDDWKSKVWEFIEDSNIKRPNEYVERQILKEKLEEILNNMLDEREAKIIKMRFWIDWPKYTLEQVWAEFWITRERVRQIEAKVLEKLREHEWLLKLLWLEDELEKFKKRLKEWKLEKVKWIPKSVLKNIRKYWKKRRKR